MRTTCPNHKGQKLVVFCPACRGAVRSKVKAITSAENGKKGGRPHGKSKT